MACFLMTATLCLTALALHRIFCSIYSISITIPLALLSSHPPQIPLIFLFGRIVTTCLYTSAHFVAGLGRYLYP